MRKLTTRRTDLMDTSDRAHREMLRRYRELDPGARLQMMLDLLDQMSPVVREREDKLRLQRYKSVG